MTYCAVERGISDGDTQNQAWQKRHEVGTHGAYTRLRGHIYLVFAAHHARCARAHVVPAVVEFYIVSLSVSYL